MDKTKAKNAALKPQITPLALAIFIGNIIWTLISMDPNERWKDIVQICVQAGLLLSGFRIGDFKALFSQLKAVIGNKNLTINEKFGRVMEIVMTASHLAGELFEEINLLQGTDPHTLPPDVVS